MSEFAAKKLGEVLAFCRVGVALAEKSDSSINSALGKGESAKFTSTLTAHAVELEKLARENGIEEITLPKADKTGQKLSSMMELYMGNEWDNPSEIMEWLGFYEGSAVVHWQLVLGVAEQLKHSQLKGLSKKAIDFHKDMLGKVAKALKKIGKEKA